METKINSSAASGWHSGPDYNYKNTASCRERTKLKGLKTTKRFSMVELILCLVVVVMSILIMVAFFPKGLDSQKRALGSSFAIDAAEQFLRYNSGKIKTDWSWSNVFADQKPPSDEPAGSEWGNTPLYELREALRIVPDNTFNPSENNNSGFFLLENLSKGRADFQAVIRAWKKFNTSDVGAVKTLIYAEVSWPYAIPYNSPKREKQVFVLEVYKAPKIALSDAEYDSVNCKVRRTHGGGFTTTLSDVTQDEESSYTIELTVDYDGCSEPDCQQLTKYVVESDSLYTLDSITGDGTQDATHGAAMPGSDLFSGFKIDFINGIGGSGIAGTFNVVYTLLDLQDQHMSVTTGDSHYIADFTAADFDFVLQCDHPIDDDTEDDVNLSINDVTGNEDDGPLSFTVTLSKSVTWPVTVKYTTVDSTAKVSDNDYLQTSGLLIFKPDAPITQTIAVNVTPDSYVELDEELAFELSNASGASISKDVGMGTIQNDDDGGSPGGGVSE